MSRPQSLSFYRKGLNQIFYLLTLWKERVMERVVSAIQPQHLVVSFGPITPDKYLIPKSSIKNVERGIVYLNENTKFVEENYRFE